jgi:hypothetical protein
MSSPSIDELSLTAFEGPSGPEHSLRFLRWVTDGSRDDLALVHVDPPITARDRATAVVVIATRHEGYSLRDIRETPVHVYVVCPRDGTEVWRDDTTSVDSDSLSIVMWALLGPWTSNGTANGTTSV